MRVRGDLAPESEFTLEQQPKKTGYVLARFFENTAPICEPDGLQTFTGFEYDEYHLELADTGSLQEDIANSFDHYLNAAKLQETENKPSSHIEQLFREYILKMTGIDVN